MIRYIEQHLQTDDLLLIASDRFFDNLFEDFIIEIINKYLVSFIFRLII